MKSITLKALNKIDVGVIIAAALALFAVQALLRPGLPTTADLTIHLYRSLEFERAWAPGVIVPRWAPNLAYGYGYPLFIFAPPLPYLLAMLFHLPGLVTIELAFKLLLIFTVMLYAAGMYWLARDLWRSVAAGLVASVAFTYAPFALRELLLVGGNAPQYLAIALFPWTLWAGSKAVQTGRWRWTALAAVLFAGVMLSHLFQAFVFSPVFGLYLLLLLAVYRRIFADLPTAQRAWAIIKPLLAAPLGLLLSAFFWLPAFVERLETRAQAAIYLEKSPFFIRYPYLPELLAWIEPLDTRAANPYVPLTLGVVTLILAAAGLLALLFRPKSAAVLPILFLAMVATGAIFMTLPVSRPVWETVSILQVSEFPWRMLGLANLGLALLTGGAALLLPQKIRPVGAAVIIAAQLMAVAPYLYPVTAFTRFGEPGIADQVQYERSSQSIGTTTLGEYLPKNVTRPPITSPLVETYQKNKIPDRLDRASLPAAAKASLLLQTAVTHRYQLTTPEPFTLRLHHFDFPGWRAELNGRSVAITPEADTGLMLIDIPAGQHTLTVQFGETPIRVAANGLSGLTVLALLVAGAAGWWRKWRGHRPPGLDVPAVLLAPSLPAFIVALSLGVTGLFIAPWLRPLFTVSSPRDRILPAQHQADVRFANGIQLAGFDISPRQIKPDGYAQIVLYWQTDGAPYRDNLQPFVHLDRLDDFSTVADATNYTPGDVTTESNLPTFHWDNSRYIRDEHDLIVPPDTPPLAFAVRVGLIDPAQNQLVPLADGSGDTAWIDTINVIPTAPPASDLTQGPVTRLAAPNGDVIQLTGFTLDAVTPERVEFSLGWQAERQPQADYTVFSQLLSADGQLASSFDRPPLDGAYPTTTWLPGQPVIEPRFIPLDGVPPGDYRLIVGLYNPETGQRLVSPAGADFVELPPLTIE